MHAFLLSLVMVMSVKHTGATIIADTYAQGEAFTMCIDITDYQTMTLNDDITLVARESGGCCPAGTTAGHRMVSRYLGGQIVCGFESDGTYAMTSSSSNGATTCVLNSCYVFKQNVECTTGTQLLNGCCGPSGARTFGDDCVGGESTFNSAYDSGIEYCTTYHTEWGNEGYEDRGTSQAGDDQADGSLVVDNVYTYAACSGDAATGAGSTSSTTSGAFSQAVISYIGMLISWVALISVI